MNLADILLLVEKVIRYHDPFLVAGKEEIVRSRTGAEVNDRNNFRLGPVGNIQQGYNTPVRKASRIVAAEWNDQSLAVLRNRYDLGYTAGQQRISVEGLDVSSRLGIDIVEMTTVCIEHTASIAAQIR